MVPFRLDVPFPTLGRLAFPRASRDGSSRLRMSPNPQTAARVLIAEDSPVCRKLLEVVFASQPYELRFVGDGVEALNQLVEFQPDILISDWLMPGMSGLELCRHVRTSCNPYTYIVLVTQKCRHRTSCRRAGCWSGRLLSQTICHRRTPGAYPSWLQDRQNAP